ncbi:hypothetical protein COO91_08636 [Nostoc flagelliforme CCNUN1]|uniref:Uncharacterized protein n=2 Tax=Nostoc TaxID=1177 RepID=A0A5P8WHA2_9NOSO|nr:hypothetical protein COO91_08636 [Nostoc flagelliforme CCNUN1]QFS52074.1 hypothetical protein GXM_09568 [Nostoc sphaeroides CCNUC1]
MTLEVKGWLFAIESLLNCFSMPHSGLSLKPLNTLNTD